ncbi:DoxX family protein [Nocardia crassostreae]|uniref:DoxX family protein n=1 Tax=Nocardia crassostreae TaxID=53428 RepID=UPI0008327CFA|nr:DoxX family protein [Nocardia crassostreae]
MTTTTLTPARQSAETSGQLGYDAGLLVLRLAIGLTLAAHGVQKLFGWFGGGGISGTGKFFTASGYPAGDVMAVIAGLSETFGGLALAAATLALTGPGRIAVDHHLPRLRQHRIGYGLAAIAVAVIAAGITLLLRN